MKIIFLDIDGVIQYTSKRFEHMNEISSVAAQLNEKLKVPFDYVRFYNSYDNNKYDIGAVYYDWDKTAIEIIRQVLEQTGAKIVMSSDWRERGLPYDYGCLAMYGLEKYLYGATAMEYLTLPINHWEDTYRPDLDKWRSIKDDLRQRLAGSSNSIYSIDSRSVEILEYLDRHPEIDAYVAIDDRNLENLLQGHFVHCTRGLLHPDQKEEIISKLNKIDGPYHLPADCITPELEEYRNSGAAERWNHFQHPENWIYARGVIEVTDEIRKTLGDKAFDTEYKRKM